MSQQFGIGAVHPSDATHYLAFASARTGGDDALLEVWNGPSSASRVFRLNEDGQAQAQDGTSGAPSYAFESDKDTGGYLASAGDMRMAVAGSDVVAFKAGQVAAVDGSAATTAYGFLNDADTGMFRQGTNAIGFAAGGSEVARINTSGLRAGDIGSGTLADARLSSNVPLLDATNVFTTVQGVQRSMATVQALQALVDGDATARWTVRPDGRIDWGDGTNPTDTNLFRSGADELQTSDSFIAGGSLAWGGGSAIASSDDVSTTRAHEHSDVTGAGTGASTSEETLMSHTLPSLTNGDMVEVFVLFTITGTAGTRTPRVEIGTTTVFENATSAGTMAVRLYLVKDGTDTHVLATGGRDGLGNDFAKAETASVELSAATINVTGQTTDAADEITAEAFIITITTQ